MKHASSAKEHWHKLDEGNAVHDKEKDV